MKRQGCKEVVQRKHHAIEILEVKRILLLGDKMFVIK